MKPHTMIYPSEFDNKNVVITGASSGIGQSTGNLFHEAGASVIGLDILPHQTGNYQVIRCDVSDSKEVQSAFAIIADKMRHIDILINCAGIQTFGNVVETSEEVWDQTIDVNLKGAFLCCKSGIPLMEDSKNPVIINVSSAQAFVTQEKVAAYAVSKEGLHALTRAIAIDFAPHIRCLAVAPGAVNTPMLQKDLDTYEDRDAIIKETEGIHLLKRIGTPSEIASFIAFLSSDQASFATGQVIRVDGGIGLKIEGA